MPRSIPQHTVVWARQLFGELQQSDLPARQLLLRAGLREPDIAGSDSKAPVNRVAAFFEHAAEAKGDPLLGLHFGQQQDQRDGGLLTYVGLNSPTVEQIIVNLHRYRRVATDSIELDISRLSSDAGFEWSFGGLSPQEGTQLREFTVVNFWEYLRKMTGRPLFPTAIQIQHVRGTNKAAFDRYFGIDVQFGAPRNVVHIREDDLKAPVPNADGKLLDVLKQCCEQVLAQLPEPRPSLADQVRHYAAERLTQGEARLERIAQALGLSPRTLTRRLADADTSFNRIVDELRKELAEKYLTETSLSITEVAFAVGYTNVSAFDTAFKRWTGQTPNRYRVQAA